MIRFDFYCSIVLKAPASIYIIIYYISYKPTIYYCIYIYTEKTSECDSESQHFQLLSVLPKFLHQNFYAGHVQASSVLPKNPEVGRGFQEFCTVPKMEETS